MLLTNRRFALPLVLAAAVLAALAGPVPVLGTLAGLVVLALPGLLLDDAAVVHRPGVRPPERVLLGVGLWLLAVLACGLLLALFQQVNRLGWIISLTVVSLGAMLASHRRGEPTEEEEAYAASARLAAPMPARSTLLWGAVTALFGVAALAVSAFSAFNAPQTGHSELWATPVRNTNVQDTAARFDLGVKSFELEKSRFVVTTTVGESEVARWEIELEPGQEWSTQTQTPRPTSVAVRLEKVGTQPAQYRIVTLSAANRAAVMPAPAAPPAAPAAVPPQTPGAPEAPAA